MSGHPLPTPTERGQRGHIGFAPHFTRVGQGLALWLGFIGLLYNPFLIFIALFVWIGAAAEAGSAQIKSTLSGTAVGRAMLTDFQTLSPNEPLTRAIELTLVGSQNDFPMLMDGLMVGVLTQTDLLKGLQARGEQAQVGDWMQREVQSAEIDGNGSGSKHPILSPIHPLSWPCRRLR